RSQGRAPRGARTTSGHHSFSDCPLYRKRCLRCSGAVAQASDSCRGRLLQSSGAAATIPFAIATGLGAWRWQLEGAVLKGNLRLHLICALTSASLIFILCWMRSRLRAKGMAPGTVYVAVTFLALMMITLTGHLGG